MKIISTKYRAGVICGRKSTGNLTNNDRVLSFHYAYYAYVTSSVSAHESYFPQYFDLFAFSISSDELTRVLEYVIFIRKPEPTIFSSVSKTRKIPSSIAILLILCD